MQRPARKQVAFAHPNSRAAVTQSQSQPPQTHARLLVAPATDGSGRYPDNVHFSHIMEHYIQLRDAEVARNTIDLAAVVPVPVPALATVQPSFSDTSNLAARPPAPSPCVTQELEPPAPQIHTLPGSSVVSS
jgi:hypothetical protein